ncbi:MAG: hypothetical protein NTV34_15445 [Proteobacteria bacterium]|nr:hypothetical protein [Pseudomonadota bacterium]
MKRSNTLKGSASKLCFAGSGLIVFMVISDVLSLTSCGVQDGPHYQEQKDFGRDPVATPLVTEETRTEAPPEIAKTSVPKHTAAEIEEKLPVEPPSTSGHDLLGHYNFKGYFDSSSVARIVNSSGSDGEITDSGIFDPILKGLFDLLTSDESNETLNILTHEDGHTKQAVTQKAHTENGDFLSYLKGDDAQSGTQILDWLLATTDSVSECPRPFICVDRIQWQSEDHSEWTYCFQNPDTKSQVVVPYGPNSQFGLEAFKAALPKGSLKGTPVVMIKHPGLVSCDNPNVETRSRQLIQWKISMGDLSRARKPGFLKKAIYKPIAPDAEIVIEYQPFNSRLSRGWQPKKPPFIDQVSRFNTKVRYFLNSQERSIVKIERTVQSPMVNPVELATTSLRKTYAGTFFASLIDQAITGLQNIFSMHENTTGLQVTYSFEFCGHRAANADRFDHCTGRVRP